ncbi:uncharacterized protein B0H18DRAFT_1104250 [Fomitopsis serialis]|uniref:uncharacterized protein n=1 Tax=Fomitopsis serialis TaxID=139415 RepID=UPI0020073567|nr:uncharacterized protein B0H18DRAFT_1104250 [Neoantrodia serialis]KAH9926966.1 hypothetical protein B0H18DRAFT_1104250 [Neoantrodia serialis]
MVVLKRPFTLLAALTTIAAVSIIPTSVEGAVVPVDYKEAEPSASTADAHHSAHGHTLTQTESADQSRSTSAEDSKTGKGQREQQPVLPLPVPTQDVAGDAGTHHKDKRGVWDESDSAQHVGLAWLAGRDDSVKHNIDVTRTPGKRHDHDHDRHHGEVIVNGDHDDVHRRTVNSRLRSRSPDDIAHVEGGALPHLLPDQGLGRRSPHDRHRDKVVVNGQDDHVHVRRSVHARRSPRHHHDHDRDRHDAVVVNGSNDNVHVPRSPHDHDDRHGRQKVVVNGDDDHVDVHHRRADVDPSVYVSGNNGSPSIAAHIMGRDGQQTVGVPGTIDIMSEDPSSENALKIASLVLSAPTNSTTTGGNSTASSFVLNASGSAHTQMYLVATPDAGNSTSSGDSTSSDNSTTTDPSFIAVVMQIPVFDAATAQMDSYCATFDPNPPAPSPLTVEECMANNTAGGEHKSQIFAYEPATGVLRPMWSVNGSALDSDGSISGSNNPTAMSSSSTSSASGSTASATTTTSAAPTGTNLAQDIVKNLEEDWTEATTPPSRMSSAKIYDVNPISQAKNVTLVFTPAAPMVAPAVSGPLRTVAPASTDDDDGDILLAMDSGDDLGDDDGDGSDDDDDDDSSSVDDSADDSGMDGSNSTSSTATASMGVFSSPAAKVASVSSSVATSSSSDTATPTVLRVVTATATSTDSAAMSSATTSAQDPSLAVEVYEPIASISVSLGVSVLGSSASTVSTTGSNSAAASSSTSSSTTTTTSASDSSSATTSASDSSSATASATDSSSATASVTDSSSVAVSTTDSSSATASGTDSSSSATATDSSSIVARYRMLVDQSSAMGTNSTSTASAGPAEMTGLVGKFREGTVFPGNKGWVQA